MLHCISTRDLLNFKYSFTALSTSDNVEAVKNATILIFAVQPKHLEHILNNLKSHLHENHVLISVITGFSIAKIEAIVGSNTCIIRSMPNTAAAVGI